MHVIRYTQLAQQNCCFWLQLSYTFVSSNDIKTSELILQPMSQSSQDSQSCMLTRFIDADDLLGLVCAVLHRRDRGLGELPTSFLVPAARLPRRGKNWDDAADMSTVKLARKNSNQPTVTPVNSLPGGSKSPSLHPKYQGMERQIVDAALNHRAASLMEYAVMIGAEKCSQFLIELQARRLTL